MKTKKELKKKSFAKGFSLVEVMVSMAILTLGISAVMILMTNNIRSAGEARDEVIAVGLANEGLEIVRNFKENNKTFKTGSKSEGDYTVDVNSTFATFNPNVSGSKKLYTNSSNFFVQASTGGLDTKFYRKISLLNGSGLITVTSYVSWNSAGSFSPCTVANKCIYVTSTMIDAE